MGLKGYFSFFLNLLCYEWGVRRSYVREMD